MPQNPNRILYADVLRIVSILFVILLHSCGTLVYNYQSLDPLWWHIGNTVDSLARWGVPVFIMLSGMLLLAPSKEESLRVYFRKRFVKVFLPFLLWALIYALWIAPEGSFSSFANALAFLGQTGKDFLAGNTKYHLKFFYYFIGLYLAVPLLRPFLKSASPSTLRYYLILWLVVNAVFNPVTRFLHLSIGFTVPIASGFVGYYLLGYYIEFVGIKPRYHKIIYTLAVIGAFATAYGTYRLTQQKGGELDQYFYGYLGLNVIAMSAGVFLFFKSRDWDAWLLPRPNLWKWIRILSSASFGIFLVHPMVLTYMARLNLTARLIHPLLGLPVTVIVCFVVSFLVVSLLKKIPVVRNLVP